jgi:hypothetical protein
MASIISHELEEEHTDPICAGDTRAGNADQCAWTFNTASSGGALSM